jgi:hypothetical protein
MIKPLYLRRGGVLCGLSKKYLQGITGVGLTVKEVQIILYQMLT